jgi:hypothetical protein
VRDAAPRCVWPGCEDRALQQSSGPEGSKYYTGCNEALHFAWRAGLSGRPAPLRMHQAEPLRQLRRVLGLTTNQ